MASKKYSESWMRNPYEFIESLVLNDHYSDSSLHNNEFVGRVGLSSEEFSEFIKRLNFFKVESGWIQEQDDKQLHVFCYSGSEIPSGDDGKSYIYAHSENKWGKSELLVPEKNGLEGVRQVKKLLDEHGVTYEPIRP